MSHAVPWPQENSNLVKVPSPLSTHLINFLQFPGIGWKPSPGQSSLSPESSLISSPSFSFSDGRPSDNDGDCSGGGEGYCP